MPWYTTPWLNLFHPIIFLFFILTYPFLFLYTMKTFKLTKFVHRKLLYVNFPDKLCAIFSPKYLDQKKTYVYKIALEKLY